MDKTSLPPELSAGAFHISDARWAHVAPHRLRAADLVSPFPGIRAPDHLPAGTIAERSALLVPRLTSTQFLSHTTAADRWGIPLPARHSRGPLHVAAIPPAREPRIAGVIGHRVRIGFDRLTLVENAPVPVPAAVWAQLGALLTRSELVVAADHILHAQLADAAELAESIARGMRGAVDLREALSLARPGSESPRETETRLVLIDAGLPEPELNWVLRDRLGRFIARLDMAYPEYRVAVEYDGRHHAEIDQFARDADRWSAIRAEGWTLIRVLSHHLEHPGRLIVTPTRRALRDAGWIPT